MLGWLRANGDAALVAHIRATKHRPWLMVPVPDRTESSDTTDKPQSPQEAACGHQPRKVGRP
jgi:hypothetical protein